MEQQENTNCKHTVRVVYENQYAGKSRLAYIVLALFFGTLGIHNFYAGRTGSGIFQLLITLFLGWLIVPLFIVVFWVLIEIIAVSKDGNGVAFK